MKIIICISAVFLLTIPSFAQFSYQAVIRDDNGAPQINENVNFEVAILQSGEEVYSESHLGQNTGTLGLVNLVIGNGTALFGSFDEIDWSEDDYSISVNVDGIPLPSSPIHSVPVAEYAKNTKWIWNQADSLLRFGQGRVAINTTELSNSSLRIQGLPDWTTLRLDQGSGGGGNGIFLTSPNSEYSGRIYLDGTNMYIGRGSGTRAIAIRDGHRVGIGGETFPQDPLHVRGIIRVEGFGSHQKLRFYAEDNTQDNRIVSYDENANQMWMMIMGQRSSGNRFSIYGQDTPGSDLKFWITQDGQTNVECLKINGGCDITEPFHNASDKQIDAGMVVIMTKNGIELSEKSHDSRVVGVISGANGVHTGMQLSQDEMFDQGLPVAIAGRVYVKTIGSVEIGDLLVSSEVQGFAQAEKEMSRAFNRTIGKALSEPDDDGYVLMLVNIQ